jgi:hypothetical protein
MQEINLNSWKQFEEQITGLEDECRKRKYAPHAEVFASNDKI